MIRVNLLGLPKTKKRARAPVVTMEGWRALIPLVLVLVVVAGAQFWRYRGLQAEGVRLAQETQRLEREKTELAVVSAEYETNSQRKELLTSRINIIETLKQQQAGPVDLLDMLATAVSSTDSLWLTNLEKTGRRVNIEGVALTVKAVADFLTRLQNSRAFSDLNLQESSQNPAGRTGGVDSFNFTITGELRPPPQPAEQAGPA